MDTRRHTRHCLRPPAELVDRYLEDPTDRAWETFRAGYLRALAKRYAEDPAPFTALVDLASREDVHLGCSCPTKRNPDVRRCHTVLALEFLAARFPELTVVFPGHPA